VSASTATSQETIKALLDMSRRKHLPLARSFVQGRSDDDKPQPGPLSWFVSAHHERAIQQYLLVHAAVSSGQGGWSVARDSRVWARALGLPSASESARAAVSKTWAWLERRQLIERGRRGRLSEITLLRDDGSGEPYAHPVSLKEPYLRLPYEFWRDEWHLTLGVPGIAVLLIALSLKDGFYLPQEHVSAWYGLSPSTLSKGITTLRRAGLLDSRRNPKTSPLSPLGLTYEYTYTLKPPFGPRGTRPAHGDGSDG
jgi:hypothetical protein